MSGGEARAVGVGSALTAPAPRPAEEASRLPTSEERELRLRVDRSSRRPVLVAFGCSLVALLLGSVFGLTASVQMHSPELAGPGWLTFGRVRTAHLNAMVYGWASLAMLGVSLWMIPRLVHQELKWARLAEFGVWIWALALGYQLVRILGGIPSGMEWLEIGLYTGDTFLTVGGGMVGVALLRTLLARAVPHLYVSVWYIMAALIWFPIIFITGNWPAWAGAESAAVNWFYAHNALGLWLTAINVGAAYYLIPKVLGRPVYSYQLSLVGFWTLGFFYSLNGMHHVIGGPMPTWMITTSITASVLMVIPVAAVAINHHMTVVGRFAALRYSPTLRFVVLGAMAYTAVSLQGIFTALREVNRITHFTQWTVGHAHVGVYAFATLILFGSIYYILPRVLRREWPSARLISWHFWLVLLGIALYVTALTVAGVFQGLYLMDPAVPFRASVDVTLAGLQARSVAAVMLTAGHVVFAWHVWRLWRRPTPERELAPFHALRPVVREAGS